MATIDPVLFKGRDIFERLYDADRQGLKKKISSYFADFSQAYNEINLRNQGAYNSSFGRPTGISNEEEAGILTRFYNSAIANLIKSLTANLDQQRDLRAFIDKTYELNKNPTTTLRYTVSKAQDAVHDFFNTIRDDKLERNAAIQAKLDEEEAGRNYRASPEGKLRKAEDELESLHSHLQRLELDKEPTDLKATIELALQKLNAKAPESAIGREKNARCIKILTQLKNCPIISIKEDEIEFIQKRSNTDTLSASSELDSISKKITMQKVASEQVVQVKKQIAEKVNEVNSLLEILGRPLLDIEPEVVVPTPQQRVESKKSPKIPEDTSVVSREHLDYLRKLKRRRASIIILAVGIFGGMAIVATKVSFRAALVIPAVLLTIAITAYIVKKCFAPRRIIG